MNDPYNKILSLMREEGSFHNEPPFLIGEVISPLPDLKIKVDNIELDKDNLKIDKWLLDRSENMSTESASCTVSHNHDIQEPIKDILKANDEVVMLRNEDTFIVISKVVSL